jgi:cell division protein FtsB
MEKTSMKKLEFTSRAETFNQRLSSKMKKTTFVLMFISALILSAAVGTQFSHWATAQTSATVTIKADGQKAQLAKHTETIKQLIELGRDDLATYYIRLLLEGWAKLFVTA